MKGQVIEMFKNSGLVFTRSEIKSIDFADFGLENFKEEGLSLIVYVNNKHYCAKEMVLLPNQTCPEHCHPSLEHKEGKQETFRCRKGIVYLYVEGDSSKNILANIPEENKEYYTCRMQIILNPGEQYTIMPNTRHWFQAGDEGAVISEFSTESLDRFDIFTNPNIKGH